MRRKLRGGFRNSRTSVERLEDRILLSAEPLVKAHAADEEKPLAVENLAYTAQTKPDVLQQMATLSSVATLIDLTQPKSKQSTKLNWAGSTDSTSGGGLLKLNTALESLVLDLGDGDSRTRLSQEGDGSLRLTREEGQDLYDLVFAKPTRILGIRGEGGLDKLVLNTIDLGTTQLQVQVEQMSWVRGVCSRESAGLT